MKAYTVQIKNKEESWRTGAVDQTILVLADDITSALMCASDVCGEIVNRLIEESIGNIENVRIVSIREEYFSVTGNVGLNYTKDSIKDRQEWIDGIVTTLKKRKEE